MPRPSLDEIYNQTTASAKPSLDEIYNQSITSSTPAAPATPPQKLTTPSMLDKVKNVLAEPFRLGAEAIAAPINSIVKAGKGYGGLYSTAKSGGAASGSASP